jgi:hypothetical protein
VLAGRVQTRVGALRKAGLEREKVVGHGDTARRAPRRPAYICRVPRGHHGGRRRA